MDTTDGVDETQLSACVALLASYEALVSDGRKQLPAAKGRLCGEVVFCLGTGPSLRAQNPQLLAGCNVISTNAGFRYLRGVELKSVCNIVTDNGRLAEISNEIVATGWQTYVAPYGIDRPWLDLVRANPSFVVLPAHACLVHSKRGWGIESRVFPCSRFRLEEEMEHCGWSVIFAAVQLAVYMGAATVVLVGVDMDYTGPQKHFFEGLKHWHRSFDYEIHARGTFLGFRRALESLGIRLVNATSGGRVDALERLSLEDAVFHARALDAMKRETGTVAARLGSVHAREVTEWRAAFLARVVRGRSGRPVYLWGDNSLGRRTRELLAVEGIAIAGVIDRRGHPAMAPDEFARRLGCTGGDRPFVLVCSSSGQDAILGELARLGLSRDDIGALPVPGENDRQVGGCV